MTHDSEIERLRAKLAETEAECLEQARLNGKGAERELKLVARAEAAEAKVAEVEKERDELSSELANLEEEQCGYDTDLLNLRNRAEAAEMRLTTANKTDNECADKRMMALLVRTIGGHSVTIIRRGKRLIGWCAGRPGRSIAMADLRAAAEWLQPDALCPVCAEPFSTGQACANDIELGTCHAECLADSPTVNLETGEPTDGPIGTFPFVDPKAEVVERLARARASIDGKLVEFEDERKGGCSLIEEDTGTYERYMADAAELLRHSGLWTAPASTGAE